MAGMSGDPFEEYLNRLAAGLRTPPARTAEIAAEAEDHLRESAAARRAAGLGEDEAQRAAIAAFGSVRQVVRAHRPSASAYTVAAAMLAWPLLAGYLVLTAALGALLLVAGSPGHGYVLTDIVARDAQGRTFITQARVAIGPLTGQLTAVLGGCLLAGVLLLAAFLLVRRWYSRSGRGLVRVPRGVFPLAAASGLLAFAFADVTGYWPDVLPAPAGTYQLADGGYYAAMLLGFGCVVRALDALAAGPGAGEPVSGRAASAAGYAVATAMKTCQVLGRYLLLTPLLGAVMLSWDTTDGGLQQVGGWTAAAPFTGCVLAGALLLAVQRLTARRCRRAGLAPARPPRWFSLPLVALGLLGLAVGEYAFFVGDVMGQLHVSDAAAALILGSQWAVVISGLGGLVRLLAALAGPLRRRGAHAAGRARPPASPPESGDLAPAG
jgi:hypothetical protein